MANFAVILPAAGKSTRFKDQHYRKPFAPLDNRAVWLHAAEKFLNRPDVKQVIVVISAEDRDFFQMKFGANVAILGIEVVMGGSERYDSVQAALAKVRANIDFVAVHDAARPLIANEWIDRVFEAAQKHEAAILAIPESSTLKKVVDGQTVQETVPRENLWQAQTPQVFRRQLLLDAYARRGDFRPSDDAQLVERLGHRVHVVLGSPINFKITTREDLRLAEQALKALPKPKLQPGGNPFADNDKWR